ncbi:hypothetical protein BDZ89DRAFT_1146610 [Hymenopellis radicata]|nr:hypothetical protein BDZ89DRAFT_1146610 [Hymenopellis radicata]
MANIILCLDVAESVVGNVLEGGCGVLRKIVKAAEDARAARGECNALAKHTACITLAILNAIGTTSNQPTTHTANIFDLCATIGEVE